MPPKSQQRSGAGYTLVELLVVLAILGLLAAVTVPQVLRYLDGAKVSATKSAIEGLSSALDLYRVDVGHFPSTQDGLAALLSAPSAATGWNGPYVKKRANLTDPWGHPYQYKAPGEHSEYDLFSLGPESTKGDATKTIGNW